MSSYTTVVEIPGEEYYSYESNRYVQDIDQFQFSFRLIKRSEYSAWAMKAKDEEEFEDLIIANCILSHPSHFYGKEWNWNTIYAGIHVTLVTDILRVSGFGEEGSPPEVEERVSEYIKSTQGKGDELIMTAYTCYKLEDLMDMDIEQWSTVHAFAYNRLNLLGVDPDLILDPESARKRLQQQQSQAPQGKPSGNHIVYNAKQ